MTSQVVGSDYTDGALLPNYVNGRLLVAEDLATSQASLRTRDTRVGETAGAGVVRGLWVTGTNTTITVAPGLAMSGAGEPVVVPRSITLQMTFATAATPASGASFSCCSTDDGSGQGSSLTSGILVLTARPAASRARPRWPRRPAARFRLAVQRNGRSRASSSAPSRCRSGRPSTASRSLRATAGTSSRTGASGPSSSSSSGSTRSAATRRTPASTSSTPPTSRRTTCRWPSSAGTGPPSPTWTTGRRDDG